MRAELLNLFNASARLTRKMHRTARFNRMRAARPLAKQMREFWMTGTEAMVAYLSKHRGWDAMQRHVQIHLASQQLSKALSDADRKFLLDLLSGFDYFSDANLARHADVIVRACLFNTFEEAATFALKQIGVSAPDFELRNESIREALVARKDAAIFSSRAYMSDVLDTINQQFYELGRHPYSAETVEKLRDLLGYKADWQAKRFALTETGIASELAQVETYRRNDVPAKQWNILDVNTRPDHFEMGGVVVAMNQKFALDPGGSNGGPFPADHPLDPRLPAHELVNCHCWVAPVMDENFQIDPSKIWEGQ